MTHTTGPRLRIVRALEREIIDAIRNSGATVSEAATAMRRVQSAQFEGMLAIQERLIREMLAPYEDVTCPTCPKGKRRAPTKGRGEP